MSSGNSVIFRVLFVLSLILALRALPPSAVRAMASNERLELPSVTVSALGSRRTESVIHPVSRVDLSAPELLAGQGIAFALTAVSGVSVQSGGGPGALVTLSIDGGTAGQTLYLIDGRPVNSPSVGSFDIGAFPAVAFDRAEIVRGPVSSASGPYGLSGSVDMAAGRGIPFADRDETIVYSGFSSRRGSFEGAVMRQDRRSSRTRRAFYDRRSHGGDRPNSDHSSGSFGYCERIAVSDSLECRFSGLYLSDSSGVPGVVPAPGKTSRYSSGRSSSLYDRQSRTAAMLCLDAEYRPRPGSTLSLKLFRDRTSDRFNSYYDDMMTGLPARLSGSYRSRSDGAFVRFGRTAGPVSFDAGFNRLAGRLSGRNATFVSGAGETSVEYLPSSAVNTAWANAVMRADDRTEISLGAGRDNPDSYGSGSSYAIGVGRRLEKKGKISVLRARGFRAPTLNDIYYPGSGNAKLSPESSIYDCVSWRGPAAGGAVGISAYRRNASDMIDWRPDPADPTGFRWMPQNVNSFVARGVTVDYSRVFPSGGRLSLSMTAARFVQRNIEEVYNDFATGATRSATVEREGRQQPSRRVAASYKLPAFGGRGSAELRAARTSEMRFYYPDYSKAPVVGMLEKTISANTVADLFVNSALGGGYDLTIGIENIFDEKYSRRFGSNYQDGNYPMPERSFSLTVRRTF